MTTATRLLASLTYLGLLLSCGGEPERRIVGTISASHTASFSAWSEPVSLGPTINSAFNDQQAALSKEGLSLYFASNRPEGPDDANLDLNIWLSRRACADNGCPWETPILLGSAVNSAFNDAGPALSRDGHQLFFFSTRPAPGSFGAADIWVSRRENVHDDFAWGAPENLGPGINTNQIDGGPGYFENEEGGAPQLYFNRSATAVVGGDIYVSEQAVDGSFGEAVPVSELNSDATDQRPSITSSGLDIYFHSDRPGSNSSDIWASTRESVLASWSPPTNVGPPINTAAGEFLPFIFSHGGIEQLYFTRNIATPPAINLDLFVSTRTRGTP